MGLRQLQQRRRWHWLWITLVLGCVCLVVLWTTFLPRVSITVERYFVIPMFDFSLMRAIEDNEPFEKINSLLEQKPELIDVTDPGGYSALHTAALLGRSDLIELLIKAGANVNAVDASAPEFVFSGWTPLHCAASSGDLKTVQLLLEYGARRDVRNRKGESPLDIARQRGHAEIVKYLESR